MERKLKKTLERVYKFENSKNGWQKDTSIPLWEGQTIKDVIPSMYDGTNFKLKSYTTEKLNKNTTLVKQILLMRYK